jgi:multiple sugar transport system permease protein
MERSLRNKTGDGIKHVLIAPALIIFLAITVFPLLFNVVMSLCNWQLDGNISFVGVNNYISVFTDQTFWKTLLNTIVIVLAAVALEYFLALLLAVNINKLLRGKKLIRISMLLPMLLAPVVIGFMWKMLFNESYGPINQILEGIGLPGVPWISQSGFALFSVILVDVWEWTPLISLILLAGLQSLPKEPFESARVDGAGEWRIFRDLTFKMLMPASVVAIMLRSIETFKIFDTIYVITAGGPGISTMSTTMYAYQVGMRNMQLGRAAAMCIIMLLIVLVSATIFNKLSKKRKAVSRNVSYDANGGKAEIFLTEEEEV